jgi:RNA polymerase sigma-70 factor (ECF subfamily)
MKLSRAEFDKLALEHLDLLYRLARRLTRDPGAAEDLVQETYVRALAASDEFDLQEYGIRPWLIRILHNLHFSRSKREKRQPDAVEEEFLESSAGATSGIDSALTAPDRPISFEMMDQQLVEAVHDLPEEYRSVLMLWAVEDMSYKEIAQASDVPIGTVMSRLHRARQRLTEKLADYARKEGIIRE